ncbi:hypothetical protein BG004_006583 [Podila humilis]|nr:hypothetical protein BG004_006583 [Podila humilis]
MPSSIWGSVEYFSGNKMRSMKFAKVGDVSEFGSGGYLFGRSQECDKIEIVSINVTNTKDVVFLRDLSIGGTFVNGKSVGNGNTIELHHGDRITAPFTFKSAQAESELTFDDQFTRGVELGVGNFATVFMASSKTTEAVYAVKEIRKGARFDARAEKILRREIGILMSINHPNLIKIAQVFNEPTRYDIVMEYATDGELFDIIIDRSRFTENEARHVFKQVLSGVKYLHDRGIVHRDLKPENILVTDKESLTVKISDFGMAKMMQHNMALSTLRLKFYGDNNTNNLGRLQCGCKFYKAFTRFQLRIGIM